MAELELPPILLIEDSDDDRLLFSKYAERAGVRNRIHFAPCGEDAIAYFELCRRDEAPLPCVAFLDIKMQGMTGFEVLAWMRAHGLAGKTVIVMHSSSDDPSDIKLSFRKGAHAYLPKGKVSEEIGKIVTAAMSFGPRQTILDAIYQIAGEHNG